MGLQTLGVTDSSATVSGLWLVSGDLTQVVGSKCFYPQSRLADPLPPCLLGPGSGGTRATHALFS